MKAFAPEMGPKPTPVFFRQLQVPDNLALILVLLC